MAGSGAGAVHRQFQRLESAGLVTVSRDGNQKYYAARKDAAVFPELHGSPGHRANRTFSGGAVARVFVRRAGAVTTIA